MNLRRIWNLGWLGFLHACCLQCGALYCFIFCQHKAIPRAAPDLEPELSAKVTLTLSVELLPTPSPLRQFYQDGFELLLLILL